MIVTADRDPDSGGTLRRPLARRAWLVAIIATAGIVVTACGDDASDDAAGVAVTGASASDSAAADDRDSNAAADADGTADDADDTDTDDTDADDDDDDDDDRDADDADRDDEDLPGTYFDIGPRAGQRMDVVGVRHDDVLNFRTAPDPSAAIVAKIAPEQTTPPILSAGEGRLLTSSAWWEVTVDGEQAWANLAFLGVLGAEDDATDDLTNSLGSSSAPTIDEFVDMIAAVRASGPEPRVELVTPIENKGSASAEVTVDILGLGDDALAGERFQLTFDVIRDDPGDSSSAVVGYDLVEAIRTLICGRGVSGSGACV